MKHLPSLLVHFNLVGLPFWCVMMAMVYGNAYNQHSEARTMLPLQLWTELFPVAVFSTLFFSGLILSSRTLYILGSLPIALFVWLWYENFFYVKNYSSACLYPIGGIYLLSFILLLSAE